MRRGILAVVALALLLAGCGQHTTERGAVAAYLRHVNRVERALTQPVASVTSVGQQFASEEQSGGTLTGLLTAAHEQQLTKALSEIETRRAELAGIRAPAPARQLRALLLELLDGEAELTRELAQLVDFLPQYSSALRPLTPATRRLETALARQTSAGSTDVSALDAAKATALRQFKATTDRMLGQIHRLHPPALQASAYRTEVASLDGMSSAAGQLATELQNGPQATVPQLLLRFERAATLNETVLAQKAQIADIRAYDERIAHLSQLSQAAEQERLSLANNLS